MENKVRGILGASAEHSLCDTMRHGNNTSSDALYLRKLGDWFRKHLEDDYIQARLLKISEKIKKSSTYIKIEER